MQTKPGTAGGGCGLDSACTWDFAQWYLCLWGPTDGCLQPALPLP